ncbi:RFC checkpoint protein Rad17 [Recurvomyces mirabilis]|nr:RFC checkpoint protein Rad17 [Recurvomyces mirabilis]
MRKVVLLSSDGEDGTSGDQSYLSQRKADDSHSDLDVESPKPKGKTKNARKLTSASSTTATSLQKSPAKSKATRSKGKTSIKETAQPQEKTIFSFFNAATQRQQRSHPSASPEKQLSPKAELINDDSAEEGKGVILAEGSSTALALRKRKAHHSTSLEHGGTLAPSATQKFRKTSDGGKAPSFAVVNEDQRTWVDQFGPVTVEDLAVHKRKVNDVRQWLGNTFHGKRRKVLVMKGAAGTGKTVTIRMLAKEMGFTVAEWQNPANVGALNDSSTSAAAQFQEFVGHAGRASSLQLAADGESLAGADFEVEMEPHATNMQRKQLLLIEEFPSTFSLSSVALQTFRSTISQYLSATQSQYFFVAPLVLVISETLLSTNTAAADSFTAHRLLGPELNSHPYIDSIEFNAVAPSILTKALESVVIKEARKSGRRKTPGPQVIKRLAESGDIRSAIASLEFLCLRGNDDDIWSGKVHFTKPKKKVDQPMTKAEEEALKLVSNRESTLGVFHAVGKIVYNKRTIPLQPALVAHPPAWLPQNRRATVSETDVDDLVDEIGTQTSTFIAALHENYALSCANPSAEEALDSLSGCAYDISDADLLSNDRFSSSNRAFSGSAMDSLRQDEMAFQVAVRGLLFDLPSPVYRAVPASGNKQDAHRMFYPTSVKLWKRQEEIGDLLDLLTARAQSGHLQTSASWFDKRTIDTPVGVESWSRNNTFRSAREDLHVSDDTSSLLSSITRAHMLLERLPYMMQILPHSSPLSVQVSRVSHTSGEGRSLTVDDEAADEENDDGGHDEAWSTGWPEKDDMPSRRKKPTRDRPTRAKRETEGGGLAIPVETEVERLVLQDDDIVDD